MATNEKLVEVLNDLVLINNDRIEGYEKAVTETEDKDVDLKGIFKKMEDQSRAYVAELSNAITSMGGTVETGTSGLSKVHRVWMDVKATLSTNERESVLATSEFGEDAAQKAYKEALASDAEMSADVRQMITSQQESLKTSHDTIKKLRDAHKAVND